MRDCLLKAAFRGDARNWRMAVGQSVVEIRGQWRAGVVKTGS